MTVSSPKLATSAVVPSGRDGYGVGLEADADPVDDLAGRGVDLDELVLRLDGHEQVLAPGTRATADGRVPTVTGLPSLPVALWTTATVSPGLGMPAPMAA